MTRRLWVINLLLLAVLAAGIVRVRQNWLAAQAREQAFLNRKVKPEAPVGPIIPPAHPPVSGAQYLDVAAQLLLSKDRNPNVVVEVEPPKVPPPFPRFYGAMDFGDGLRVVLAEKSGGRQRSYKIGDKIGDLTIQAVSRVGMEFDWNGKTLTATMAELRDIAPVAPPVPAATPAAAPQQAGAAVIGGSPTKPGVDIAADTKGCQAGDTSPAGTVQDGYRKVMSQTPFGSACRWERIK